MTLNSVLMHTPKLTVAINTLHTRVSTKMKSQRERERERERQTDRQTDRQISQGENALSR